MFSIANINILNKYPFLKLVRIVRTSGATKAQSRTSKFTKNFETRLY